MTKIKALKINGINVTKELSILEINKIAAIISEKICNTYPEHNLNKSDLFIKLSRLNMYLAEFKDNSAAKYYYIDDSIYFNQNIDFNNITTPAIHECLHYLQAVKTPNGKLKRLGLYELNLINETGLALNEASVQLMASIATNDAVDTVKYYGLEFTTESPNYYPIECSLVKQMAYFTGTYPLYHSTLYSNDIFKNTFIMKSSEKTYNEISKNMDSLVKLQEALQKENEYLAYIEYNDGNSSKIKKAREQIEGLKNNIKTLTLQTQELIIVNCVNSDLNLVRDKKDIREFKEKLYNFQNNLIISEGYTFFNDFYCKMMEELSIKRDLIEKYGIISQYNQIPENLSLVETRKIKQNPIKLAFEKIKQLLKLNQENSTLKEENFIQK